MAPYYSKNGILKGTVDFYCLVCETYLRSESDNIDHIEKPIHKKNLDSTQYVKDFEEDFIRKIKKGYFCELCNKLLPMMARVKIHVKEPAHVDGKNVMYFKRNGLYVIAFGKVVLNDKAWNGLNEESCAFCNTEYEDEEIHKSQPSHILNIIQIKVEVDENKNIYRKIDDVSFHCLTCNMVLALNNITHHFEGDQHKTLYIECCTLSLTNINKNELKEKEVSTVIEDQSDKTKEHLPMPLNNTGENTEKHIASGSDVNIKCDVLEETTAIDARPLNELCENEEESKIATNSVVNQESKDSKENSKTSENKHLYQECCAISLTNINKNELKEKEVSTVIENQSDKTNEHLTMPLNNTGENTEQEYFTSGSNVNLKCDVLEKTAAFDAKPLNEICENEKESKIATNSVVNQESEGLKANSKNFPNFSNKTSENKEEIKLKTVQDIDVDKNNKKLADKKVKKCKTKIDSSQLNSKKKSEIPNEIKKTTSFNIEKYEKLICKMLKTEDYITLDENGKTLCILCDWIMDPKTKKIHSSGLHHKTMEKMHKRRLAEIGGKNRKNNIEGETRDKNTKENTVQNKSILDLVSEFQANNVNINLLFNTAVCKKCTINLPFDVDAIEEHILKHNKKTCKEENKEDKETCENSSEVTMKENRNDGNVRNENEEKLNTVVDEKGNEPTIKQAPVNIDEKLISNNTSLKPETESGIGELSVSICLQKQSLASYIKIITVAKHMIFQDVVINDIVCISFTSFNYFLAIKGVLKCLVCEEEVRDIEVHNNTLKHIEFLNDIPVIINEKTEFVREIHPNMLHCGFCNMTVSSWSEMQEHFSSSIHKECKDAAGWRMIMYTNIFGTENNYKTFSEISQSSMRNMFTGLF